ncbi:MAG: aminoacetone oxidase family FAD-binding enzyme, partial [Bacteroidales bacterium]|nr:aminoacetone oxidase family FAD-binding enzyme [Bacteroidales bacterium]
CLSPNGLASNSILSKAVIIATGGLSYPSTGSTGMGYELAESFRHTIVNTFPSLTALVPEKYDESLYGIELNNVELNLMIDKDLVQSERGDVSFTTGGIEGSLGYRVSRKAVKALINGQKVALTIDLKHALSLAQLSDRISRDVAALGASKDNLSQSQMKLLLRGLMPAALIAPFMAYNKDLNVDNLPAKLKEWYFVIKSYVGYKRAVVTAGGVAQSEIVAKSMRSKLVPNLYFAGEVIDIDGDTGGYNLQIAFSTGALAGTNAAQQILKLRRV